ncbi:hypothetical protein CRG98_010706 [Punica granatum]|uniref:Uncharacterized protein n=1 Tax=Punica granatum TaxID=22663 RepID=A0A2I0KL32_PUNGR|nr:hypothetical protein CRG98_010706 [Punica granatum]
MSSSLPEAHMEIMLMEGPELGLWSGKGLSCTFGGLTALKTGLEWTGQNSGLGISVESDRPQGVVDIYEKEGQAEVCIACGVGVARCRLVDPAKWGSVVSVEELSTLGA